MISDFSPVLHPLVFFLVGTNSFFALVSLSFLTAFVEALNALSVYRLFSLDIVRSRKRRALCSCWVYYRLLHAWCFGFRQHPINYPEEGFIYAYGGPLAGRFLKKFRLPALSDSDADGKVTFTDEDVLETVTFQDVRVPQGSMVRKGLAVIPQGCPPLERNLHFIDMATQEKLLVMDLSDFDIEPEGIDRKGDWIYLSFFSKDKEVNTNLYRIKIKVR